MCYRIPDFIENVLGNYCWVLGNILSFQELNKFYFINESSFAMKNYELL